MSENLSEHVAENRRYWDAMADEWVSLGERAWESEARWGEWGILRLPPNRGGIDYKESHAREAEEVRR